MLAKKLKLFVHSRVHTGAFETDYLPYYRLQWLHHRPSQIQQMQILDAFVY